MDNIPLVLTPAQVAICKEVNREYWVHKAQAKELRKAVRDLDKAADALAYAIGPRFGFLTDEARDALQEANEEAGLPEAPEESDYRTEALADIIQCRPEEFDAAIEEHIQQ